MEQHEDAGEQVGGGRRPDPADLRGVDGMRLSWGNWDATEASDLSDGNWRDEG